MSLSRPASSSLSHMKTQETSQLRVEDLYLQKRPFNRTFASVDALIDYIHCSSRLAAMFTWTSGVRLISAQVHLKDEQKSLSWPKHHVFYKVITENTLPHMFQSVWISYSCSHWDSAPSGGTGQVQEMMVSLFFFQQRHFKGDFGGCEVTNEQNLKDMRKCFSGERIFTRLSKHTRFESLQRKCRDLSHINTWLNATGNGTTPPWERLLHLLSLRSVIPLCRSQTTSICLFRFTLMFSLLLFISFYSFSFFLFCVHRNCNETLKYSDWLIDWFIDWLIDWLIHD